LLYITTLLCSLQIRKWPSFQEALNALNTTTEVKEAKEVKSSASTNSSDGGEEVSFSASSAPAKPPPAPKTRKVRVVEPSATNAATKDATMAQCLGLSNGNGLFEYAASLLKRNEITNHPLIAR
jgi:hypothetical protein